MSLIVAVCLLPLFTSCTANRVALEGGRSPCQYDTLEHAVTAAGSDARSVQVVVCDEWKMLSMDEPRPKTFEEVDWWRPSTMPMTEAESSTIGDYCGHYWYARNLINLFKGVAPALTSEDPQGRWVASDRESLVKEVLKFGVVMGSALNKLPTPEAPLDLYRAAWVPKEVKDHLLSQPRGMKHPWFQSTSSDESHTYMFLRPERSPEYCRSTDCIESEVAYPVHYKYRTTQAKDVTKWNLKEHEHILLPNLAFDVVSVERVLNDPLYTMTSEELAAWFEKTHASYEGFESPEPGPWPEWAQAVRRTRMDGRTFSVMYRKSIYSVSEALGLGMDASPYTALQSRFSALPPMDNTIPDTNPYYFKIMLQDAGAPIHDGLPGGNMVHWWNFGACYWTDRCSIETLQKTHLGVSGKVKFEAGPCPEGVFILEAGPTTCGHA